MKSKVDENGFVRVMSVGSITEDGDLIGEDDGFGFVMISSDGDRTAFVHVGDRHRFLSLISRNHMDILEAFFDQVLRSDDEMVQDLVDDIRDGERGFILNGEHISNQMFESVHGANGEKENSRIGKANIDLDEEVSV